MLFFPLTSLSHVFYSTLFRKVVLSLLLNVGLHLGLCLAHLIISGVLDCPCTFSSICFSLIVSVASGSIMMNRVFVAETAASR